MPIYMDVHILPGVKANDVAEAHHLDLMMQSEHNCKCMTYWVDEARGEVFCLIDAPAKEVVTELHNKAHGLVPNKIIEVQAGVVEAFLGRVRDPEDVPLNENGLKLLNDPSLRVLLVVKILDPVLQQCMLGKEKAQDLYQKQVSTIRQAFTQHGGQEAEHDKCSFIASFTSAAKAIACAKAIQDAITKNFSDTGLRIGIGAGQPVSRSSQLFGDTIQSADRICFIAKDNQVGLAASVTALLSNHQADNNEYLFSLSPSEEQFLARLFETMAQNVEDPDCNLEDYCQTMAMSKSQLYRKTMAIANLSPNLLLKEYRLEKARELLRKKQHNISEISFTTGFTSPSYFTKCFKKKYGVLPMAYAEMA